MSAPGLNAQASLYRSLQHYTTTTLMPAVGSGQFAMPALPIRNGGGNGGCHVDCTSCDATCHRTCTNSCTGRPVTSFCCGPGYSCQNGTCVCPVPKTACGGVCVDTSSDPANCGSCGNACAPGQTCQQGGCYPTPLECGACSPAPNSVQECCQQVSPDQIQCGIAPCPAGCGTQPYPWCGQSYPTVISCPCPTGQICKSICQGELCSVDWHCQ